MSRTTWAILRAMPISRNSFFEAALAENGHHFVKSVILDLADVFRQPVGQFGGARRKAGCIDGDFWMRDTGKARHIFRFVPDNVEIGDDPLDEMPSGTSAFAMLQR